MPLYLIERRYAEQLFPDAEDADLIEAANADAGVQWLFSFLTADRRQSYCLYEAMSPDALRAAARRANLPADVIVEVSRMSAASIREETAGAAAS
jgi:hypothetical protein